VQLFSWLFAVVLLASALSAYVSIRTASEQWTQSLFQTVSRTSELIKRSTRYSMLLDRKEDVHQTIRMIAKDTGVVAVRVYNKEGTVVFSAEQAEVGTKVDPQAEACTLCHDHGRPPRAAPADPPVRVFRGPDGARVLALSSPIANEVPCSTAACHVHPQEQTVLGVLDVEMSMAYAEKHLALTMKAQSYKK
jgi:hypothetical protein